MLLLKTKNLFLVSRDKRDLLPIKSDIEQKFDSKVEILELDFTSIKEIEQKLLSKKRLQMIYKVLYSL